MTLRIKSDNSIKVVGVDLPVSNTNGVVYSKPECIHQYCPHPEKCKAQGKCINCQHKNITQYCSNCEMEYHDERINCQVCGEKLFYRCDDCEELLK